MILAFSMLNSYSFILWIHEKYGCHIISINNLNSIQRLDNNLFLHIIWNGVLNYVKSYHVRSILEYDQNDEGSEPARDSQIFGQCAKIDVHF